MPNTAPVRTPLQPVLERVHALVDRYFSSRVEASDYGSIRISGERYILVRAASMSVEFFELVEHLYRDAGEDEAFEVARNLLFDVAHAMGLADAEALSKRIGLKSPVDRLAAGPAHSAHAGWAQVEFHNDSQPTPGDDFLLIFDLPTSFEADAWANAGRRPTYPVCTMSAGYSSGWSEASFGIPLAATEVQCRGRGDERCRFLMAPPNRLEDHVDTYLAEHPELSPRESMSDIPGFFGRKEAEAELREREAQYRAVFEAASDALFVIELDGTIVQANPEAASLFSIDLPALVHRAISSLVDIEDFVQVASRAIAKTGRYVCRAAIADNPGAQRHVEVRAAPILHRGNERILVLIHDVTARERTRRELQQANTALESRSNELRDANLLLTELNEDLVRARDQAVAASRAKSEFLARMSHELRTPLNAVIGYAELVREETVETGKPPEVEDLDRIINAGDHLLQLINEVLDIAKIEAGEMSVSIETFDLDEFVSSLVDVVRPSLDKNGNDLVVERAYEPLRVAGDQVKLRQILLNLLSNAAKFTEGGTIRFAIATENRDGETFLCATVRDEGIGMSAETLSRLFEPFRQADESTTRRFGGTGLGLAISRGYARLMGGEIDVRSALGAGSTLTLEVPVWVLPTQT